MSGGRGWLAAITWLKFVWVNIMLYWLTVSTAWVITMQLDKPLSELRYFFLYYLLTLPVLVWGALVIPAMILVDHFAGRNNSRNRRRILIASGLLIVGISTAYFVRYLPAVLILGAGGAIYGWLFPFRSESTALKVKRT